MYVCILYEAVFGEYISPRVNALGHCGDCHPPLGVASHCVLINSAGSTTRVSVWLVPLRACVRLFVHASHVWVLQRSLMNEGLRRREARG